jgi:hypothetical protein
MHFPRTIRHACAAALACAATLAVVPAASAATATLSSKGWKTDPEVWGVNDRALTWNLSDADLAPRLAAMQKLKAKWVRFPVNWPRIQEAGPGTYRWTDLDSMVKRLAKAGLRWRPVTVDVPQWLKTDPDLAARQPASSSAPVADFIAALLARYGQNGAFWKANPTVTARPVLDIELHNEPNHVYFWGIDPATTWYRVDYDGTGWAKLYGPALDTLYAKYPSVRYWIGGLSAPAPSVGNGTAAATFVHNAFATHPSLKQTLAGAGVHTYPWSGTSTAWSDPAQAGTAVMGVLYALRAYGRDDMKVQVNEFGASKTRVTDEKNRVAIFNEVADLVRSNCAIQGFAPFEDISAEADPNQFDDWYGMVSRTTGALYAEGAAWAAKVTAYNAGTVKGAQLNPCL